MDRVEVVIIGAGLHGLAAAKTYLEVSPDADLLIVDKGQSVGGTWAAERLYPGLKTNNLVGSYEFSDFPMVPERYGLKPGDHIPGTAVHEYFHDFTEHFNLYPHIQFSTRVTAARLQPDHTWELTLTATTTSRTIQADKLIVATGLTSEPNIPTFTGQDSFNGHIFHARDLSSRAKDIAASKNAIVIGGNKSAWDACYTAAKTGTHVDMVIRPSGGGPSFVWPASFKVFGMFKTSLARLSSTRLFTSFDPSLHPDSTLLSPFRRFIHRSSIGNKLLTLFWRGLGVCIKRLNRYDSHPELQKLKPWITPFWMGNSLSIHNYDTCWFDLVREGKIHVHIADVKALSRSTIYLSNGTELQADTIICCTGWKTTPSIHLDSGSLTSPTQLDTLEIAATKSIHRQLSYLDTLPRRESHAPEEPSTTTDGDTSTHGGLYRFMIPCSDAQYLEHRNIAFIGAHSSVHAAMVAQAQALWIVSFFQGKIPHLSPSDMSIDTVQYDSVLHSVYGAMRRPHSTGGAGRKYPDLVFDSLPYVDTLLGDLGVRARRKSSVFQEVLEPYRVGDYRGVVKEWMDGCK